VHITGWHIDAFGVLYDVGARELPPGLVVLEGPNAAGKSTLLAFIRRTLFGHPHGNRRDVNHYLPPEGDRRGGRLYLEADGEVIVERHAGTGAVARVVRADGTVGGDEMIAELTGGCDEQLFNTVFAFDLGDLGDDGLGDEEIRDRLFSAGVRGAGTSARTVRDRLTADARALWTPRTRTAAIDQLQVELSDIEARLADARRVAAGYPQRLDEEQAAEARVRELDQHLDALSRLEQLEVRIEDAAERLEHVEQEHAEAQRLRSELVVDEELEAMAERVLRLDQERAAQRDRLVRLQRLDAEIQRHRETLEATLADLGGSWDEQRLQAVDVSARTRAEIRRWQDDLERAREESREASRDLELAEEAVEQARRREERAGATPAATGEEGDAVVDGEDLDARRARLSRLRAALAEADAAESALEAATRLVESRGPELPSWTVPVVGALAGLVTAGAVWAALAGATAVVVLLSIVVVALVILGVLARLSLQETQSDDPVVVAHQASQRAVESLTREAAGLGLPSRPTYEDLEKATAELDRLDRRRSDLERLNLLTDETAADREAAETRLTELRERKEAVDRELAELEERWASWCAERDLDTTARPAEVAETLTAVERARDQQLRLDETLEASASLDTAVGRYAQRVDQALTGAGRAEGTGPEDADGRRAQLEVLGELAEAARAAQRAGQEARRLDGRLQELEPERERLRTRREALEEEARVQQQRLAQDDDAVSGSEGQLAEVATRRREVAAERDDALEHLVECRRRVEEVETSELVAELDQRRQVLYARRDALVHDWRVATVACQLVARTLEGFERDRQPGVLRTAGEYFAQVTDHGYRGVVQEGDQMLVVDDADRTWTVDTLSRGTAEQLYLCMRLALAEDLASRRQRLPFVMDDVLVNFDPRRAAQVAGLLARVARDGQLLFFTCQPSTTELLLEAGAAAIYDLPGGGGAPERRSA
jgi:uncharacterized protein YhaN